LRSNFHIIPLCNKRNVLYQLILTFKEKNKNMSRVSYVLDMIVETFIRKGKTISLK